jgi:putative nucleotidyltransferase with HDIG domain
MKEIIDKILAEQTALLSLPQTLSEVLRVVRDESASAGQLADVLLRDPALTAKVLRIANSPFYGVSREISSMNQAVVTLGTRQVTTLALSSSIYNLTGSWQSSIDRVRFWRHSLEVAIAARMIAEKTGFHSAEEAFIGGLLHDLGLLPMEKAFPEDVARIDAAVMKGESRTDLEEQAWATNHARVGQFMLEQWHLPSSICSAVGHHHDLFAADSVNPDIVLPQIVCLANLVSQFTISEARRNPLLYEIDNREVVRHNLGLSSEDLLSIQQELFGRTVEEAGYLEIEVGDPQALLTEANKVLYEQYLAVEELLRENRRLQEQISTDRLDRLSVDSLRSIALVVNRHVNNATANLVQRARQVEASIGTAEAAVSQPAVADSLRAITGGIETISSVLRDLTNLACLDRNQYPDRVGIIDMEERIKERMEQISAAPTI